MATEIERIIAHANSRQSFVLAGGAGSGKTYALIETIKGVYASSPKAKIACITFTNVAVNEIKERAPFEDLVVLTIHEFLWMIISRYQSELKSCLAELIQQEGIKVEDRSLFTKAYFEALGKNIEYREWVNYEKGVISHDDLIKMTSYMFEHNTRMGQILADTYDYIFVDEYQDTFPEVIHGPIKQILKLKRNCTIGLFGDPMQAIYDRSSPENVDALIQEGLLLRETTLFNRRNPGKALGFINQLRLDDIKQEMAGGAHDPNTGKKGSILFLYSEKNERIENIRKSPSMPPDFSHDLKELFLVKRFIAEQAGFASLHDIYVDDPIIKLCRYSLSRKLKKLGHALTTEETFKEILDLAQVEIPDDLQRYSGTHEDILTRSLGYKFENMNRTRLDADLYMGTKKMSEYDSRNRGQRCDDLIQYLMGLQEVITLYETGRYNEFIRKTTYQVKSIADKKRLRDNIDTLVSMKDKSIAEVMEYADKAGIWVLTDKVKRFQEKYAYRFMRVVEIDFSEIINLYDYTENNTPYSTQHGIKGAEFKNVFVILDNGGWKNYNFEYLFEQRKDKDSVVRRTQKMFYVCCSRTLDNLVIYYQSPSELVLKQAEVWFGKENVKQV